MPQQPATERGQQVAALRRLQPLLPACQRLILAALASHSSLGAALAQPRRGSSATLLGACPPALPHAAAEKLTG